MTIVACAVLATLTLHADLADLPVKEVNGRRYHYYEVQPRETVYSLTRKLGITPEKLYECNPASRDGLKAYEVLLFPVDGEPAVSHTSATTAAPAPQRRVHKVKKGETVFGISKKYGLTKEQIFEWNPDAVNGIKAGQDLYISPAAESVPTVPTVHTVPSVPAVPTVPQVPTVSQTPAPASPAPAYTDYVVKDKETFYSIARSHNISIVELEKANPGVGLLREGMVIKVPSPGSTQPTVRLTQQEPAVPVSPVEPAAPVSGDTVVAEEVQRPRAINIALTLPLMSNVEQRTRQADMYLDFYKGFLIAVDSMRHCGTPINVYTYDTHGTLSKLDEAIATPGFGDVAVVIGPDEEEQLTRLGNYGRMNEVYVFNPFVVRDESYLNNPYMMQSNIPQTMMYDKAIEGLITRYADYLPVFLNHNGSTADKEGFVTRLKNRLDQAGIESRTVSYDSQFTIDDAEALPANKKLLLIPTSGRMAELNRVLPTAVSLKDKGRTVMMFGYPEWTTFRGETLENMHKVGTTVYSRFFTPDDNEQSAKLDGRFIYWYGEPMLNVLPRQGLLGFDTGMYLIKALKSTNGNLSLPTGVYDGIQNGFHFSQPAGSQGLVNDMLYFVTYRQDGTIDKTTL